jgi:hypothetical protein
MVFGFTKKNSFEGGGIVLFTNVEEAIAAEKVLKAVEYETKLVAPPPELRKGCDLALEINLVEKTGVERMLHEKKLPFLEILPVKSGSELLQVVQVTDFGSAIMVKAGNMKLTFDRGSGVILNVSGGGCPDIPFLHAEMLDKKLAEAPRPRDRGYTLCSLMLDRAFVESLDIWSNGRK